MFKKIVAALFTTIILIGIVLSSCKKSSNNVAFTNATMKPWFDTNCSSCHASGKSDAKKWLYDANDETTIQNNISSIYKAVYTSKTMPPTGISAAELAKFKSWYDSGHPSL
jgi:cytochrome c5